MYIRVIRGLFYSLFWIAHAGAHWVVISCKMIWRVSGNEDDRENPDQALVMTELQHPPLPHAQIIKKAIDIYLPLAYGTGQIPDVVKARIAPILTSADSDQIKPEWFESADKDGRAVYRLRLGHSAYPHMKLNVEESPDGTGYLLLADAHDMHLLAPETSPDAKFLGELRKNNAALVEKIQSAWTQAGLPTFRNYFRAAMERRVRAK